MKDSIESLRQRAEPKVKSLWVEVFSSLSISLSMTDIVRDVRAIESLTKGVMEAWSLCEHLQSLTKVVFKEWSNFIFNRLAYLLSLQLLEQL